MRNPRRVLSKAQILDRVWNYDFGGQANVVELYISYLRKKIDAGREPMIHTLRGAGYVLKPAPAEPAEPGRRLRSDRGGWTLRARLIAAAGRCPDRRLRWSSACVTVLALRGFLVGQLDDQLDARPRGARRRPRRPASPAPARAHAGAATAPGRPGLLARRARPPARSARRSPAARSQRPASLDDAGTRTADARPPARARAARRCRPTASRAPSTSPASATTGVRRRDRRRTATSLVTGLPLAGVTHDRRPAGARRSPLVAARRPARRRPRSAR